MSTQDLLTKSNTDSYIFINENANEQSKEFVPVSSSVTLFQLLTPQTIGNKFSGAKEWVTKTSSKLRPWTEFFQFSKISKPKTISSLLARVYRNLFYFQNNYVFLILGLVAYCLFTNPLLLLILAGWCVIWWLVNFRSVDGEIKCAGHILGVKEIIGISFFASLPLLYFAGVGSLFFWLIGVTMVIVGMHASMIDFEETDGIPMDEISNEV